MHFKTLKYKRLSFDEEKNFKRDHGMLDLTKTNFPTNFHTYMMIISHDFNRKLILMKFWRFSPKAHLHIVIIWFFCSNSSNVHHISTTTYKEVHFNKI